MPQNHEALAGQAAEHVQIARLMADHYDPEVSHTQIPPKVYDEVVGRAWEMEEVGNTEGASLLRAAVHAIDCRDERHLL